MKKVVNMKLFPSWHPRGDSTWVSQLAAALIRSIQEAFFSPGHPGSSWCQRNQKSFPLKLCLIFLTVRDRV